MLIAKHANQVVKIDDYKMEQYLKKGFDIYDSNHILIKKAVPVDVDILRLAYVEHEAEIKRLKAEIAELKGHKSKLAEPTEIVISDDEPEVVREAKKRMAKKTK